MFKEIFTAPLNEKYYETSRDCFKNIPSQSTIVISPNGDLYGVFYKISTKSKKADKLEYEYNYTFNNALDMQDEKNYQEVPTNGYNYGWNLILYNDTKNSYFSYRWTRRR